MRQPPLNAAWISFAVCLFHGWLPVHTRAQAPGDAMLTNYFQRETTSLQHHSLAEIKTIDDWKNARDGYRHQLQEMLGLDPLPARTPLRASVTGTTTRDGIIVERLHFQSRPGLYVTGNLYRPADVNERLPAILYVCGHGGVKMDGISYGNKVHYQHHGAWLARNGYVCLTIDSVQLGEIESIHHGTYRYDMWWWLCRGYTPAGVEAWNCIRAIDYLQSRPDVDPERLGVTGRSGGGIYSWWLAALDDRIQAAVPVAGLTDLVNHIVDGCVEGHCDCMFMVNTYRWDYPQVAAMVAPRPLLISNSDRDDIFPLDGVVRTHRSVKRIYVLHDAADRLALNITAGPHQDTQELRIHAFRWFNHFLRDDDELIEDAATSRFEPAELKVFDQLPEDERNTTVHEWFVPRAPEATPPSDGTDWKQTRDRWKQHLDSRVFAGWPVAPAPLNARRVTDVHDDAVQLSLYEFDSQPSVRLPLYVIRPQVDSDDQAVRIRVLDEAGWQGFCQQYAARFASAFPPTSAAPPASEVTCDPSQTVVLLPPRGIGPSAWNPDPRKQIQIRRRFYLLGQTRDGMRVWDLRRAIQLVHDLGLPIEDLTLQADGEMAGIALYAALYEPRVKHLKLGGLSASHRDGPYVLNVQRFLDLPQVLAMVAEGCQVQLSGIESDAWSYATETQSRLNWSPSQLVIEP